MNYAKCIIELRKKMALTQSELASILEVGVISVSRWEQGHHEPTLKVKKHLRHLFKEADITFD